MFGGSDTKCQASWSIKSWMYDLSEKHGTCDKFAHSLMPAKIISMVSLVKYVSASPPTMTTALGNFAKIATHVCHISFVS